MPSTTNFAIPYPQASDTVDVPRDIQAVADQLELKLDPLRYQYSHRNAIINGDFSINQRSFSSTTANVTYGFDRWLIGCVGGTVTYSSQVPTLGNVIAGQEPFRYARVVTTGQSAAGDLAILSQRIEGVRTFAGQTVTVSFWAKANSGTPKVAVEFEQNFGTGGSPSSAVFSGATQVTLSTSWVRYSATITLPSISGKTIGTGSDNYLQLNLWVSGGSTWNTRTGTIGIQTNTFDFWGVQVEAGSYATSFERRPYAVELAMCQRYYYRTSLQSGATYGSVPGFFIAQSTTASVSTISHPVPMRANPQAVDTTTASLYGLYDGTNIVAVTSITFDGNTNPWTARIYGNTAGSLVQYRVYTMIGVASSAVYIGFSAEL